MRTEEGQTPDIVVLGGADTDFTMRGERWPEGESAEAVSFHQLPGGKGVNQATAAARLGAKTALISKVGNDERGRVILSHLKREGIACDHVYVDPAAETGAVLLMVRKDGKEQSMSFPGANQRMSVEELERARPLIESASVLLVQMELPFQVVARAMEIANQSRTKIVFDPSPLDESARSLLPYADVLQLNLHEASKLTGVEIRDRATAKEAATQLLDGRVSAVMIETPCDAHLLLTHGGEDWIPFIRMGEPLDRTGAGDAISAALAVGLSEELHIERAALLGNAAAALTILKPGGAPSMPERADVEACLKTARNFETTSEGAVPL